MNGQRAYALVRKGQDVTLAARRVTVSDFTVLATRREGPFIDLDVTVECTSGTYVRALARDLGAGLGVGGHLTALRRTRIGRYLIDDAVQLPDRDSDQPAPPLMPMARAAELSFPVVHIDAAQRQAVGYGKPLDLVLPGPLAGLVDEQGSWSPSTGPMSGSAGHARRPSSSEAARTAIRAAPRPLTVRHADVNAITPKHVNRRWTHVHIGRASQSGAGS